MDLFDLERKTKINNLLQTIAKNVRQKRIKEGKTVEDIAYSALGHNATFFYNSAEKGIHDKRFNLIHLLLLAEYYGCDIRDFFSDGGSNNASIE